SIDTPSSVSSHSSSSPFAPNWTPSNNIPFAHSLSPLRKPFPSRVLHQSIPDCSSTTSTPHSTTTNRRRPCPDCAVKEEEL
ncbi:hypothetical protein PFISCL1PPCAC_26153, partial [Pristionchus fissidentatus]